MSAASESNRWTTPGAMSAANSAALSDEARAQLSPGHSPKQFVAALASKGLSVDAMRVVPFALTKREAIWWAAQCLRGVPHLAADPKAISAIGAAEKWCANPSDDNRRTALLASEMAVLSTPAGCLAMAVFLSEGSLAPPAVAAVPPPPNVGPSMAGNAVLLAAVVKNPERAMEKYSLFLQLAEAVAAGTNLWSGARPATPVASSPPATPGAKTFPPYPQPKR